MKPISLPELPPKPSKDVAAKLFPGFAQTETIHATCEDFRASADIGLEMDEADERAGNKIVAPVHALWGAKGTAGPLWDVLATWRAKAISVTGRSLDCGHFLQEEQPEEMLRELLGFFAA